MNIQDIQDQISTKRAELRVLEAQLEKAAKDKVLCPGCNTYFDKKQLMTGQFQETVKNECVYTDAGYGDTDEYADVTYLRTVVRCPKCGRELKRNSIKIGEANRWSRFDRC